MEPVGVLDVAARQVRALSMRQAVVAGNIANVNTPGYRTREVEPFQAVAQRTHLAMATTNPAHLGLNGSGRGETLPTTRAGGPVELEREMLKAGEINRGHQLATSLTKSFHRMLIQAARTGS